MSDSSDEHAKAHEGPEDSEEHAEDSEESGPADETASKGLTTEELRARVPTR